ERFALILFKEHLQPVHEVPQDLQLGQVAEHGRQVGLVLFAHPVPTLDDRPAVLEDERRLLLVGQPASPGATPGRALSLPLPAPVAPPGQPPAQAADGIQAELVEVLEGMAATELMPGVRPTFCTGL